MGFPNPFGGSKDAKDAKGAPEASTAQPKPQAGFSIKPEATPTPSAAQQEGSSSAQTRASSVFEFGPTVSIGQDYMRGVCIGEDPDAIQACTWSVETAQGKPRDKHHLYRIEF